jgi:hypothetical protein
LARLKRMADGFEMHRSGDYSNDIAVLPRDTCMLFGF